MIALLSFSSLDCPNAVYTIHYTHLKSEILMLKFQKF